MQRRGFIKSLLGILGLASLPPVKVEAGQYVIPGLDGVSEIQVVYHVNKCEYSKEMRDSMLREINLFKEHFVRCYFLEVVGGNLPPPNSLTKLRTGEETWRHYLNVYVDLAVCASGPRDRVIECSFYGLHNHKGSQLPSLRKHARHQGVYVMLFSYCSNWPTKLQPYTIAHYREALTDKSMEMVRWGAASDIHPSEYNKIPLPVCVVDNGVIEFSYDGWGSKIGSTV